MKCVWTHRINPLETKDTLTSTNNEEIISSRLSNNSDVNAWEVLNIIQLNMTFVVLNPQQQTGVLPVVKGQYEDTYLYNIYAKLTLAKPYSYV